MLEQILIYSILALFVLFYVEIGTYIAELLASDKTYFKQILIGTLWPVILIFIILIFGLLFVIACVGVVVLIFIVLFNICKSLIKGEKIDWDKEII